MPHHAQISGQYVRQRADKPEHPAQPEHTNKSHPRTLLALRGRACTRRKPSGKQSSDRKPCRRNHLVCNSTRELLHALRKQSTTQQPIAGITSPRTQQRLTDGGEEVELVFTEVLADPGKWIRHVYFPINDFISLTVSHDERTNLEVGLIGDEGMLGTSLVQGIDASPLHALVQGAGKALRIDAGLFRKELKQSPELEQTLKRYLYVVMQQLAQTSVCTRFHVVEARLARWLLMTQDRAHTDRFQITHEFIAYMLGVRRVGITKAATALQKLALISYNRGDMRILDRTGLIELSCDCYKQDKKTYLDTMHF